MAVAASVALAVGARRLRAAAARSGERRSESRLREATLRAECGRAARSPTCAAPPSEAQSALLVLVAPDLARIDLAGQPAAPTRHRARLLEPIARAWCSPPSNLPAPPRGRAYQLWVLTAQPAPISAGMLTPDASGRVNARFDTPPDLPRPVAMAVTLEPEGGVPVADRRQVSGRPRALRESRRERCRRRCCSGTGNRPRVAFAGSAFWPDSSSASAISPSSSRSAKPGAGMKAGRCMARPSARANSALVTGCGAGRVDRRRSPPASRSPTAPARSSRRGESTASTAVPIRPVRRRRSENGGSICGSAPPSFSSTMPVRMHATRVRSLAARVASCSHRSQTLREKIVSSRRLFRHRLVAERAVVADRGSADEHGRRRRRCRRSPRRGCASRARGCRGCAASARRSTACPRSTRRPGSRPRRAPSISAAHGPDSPFGSHGTLRAPAAIGALSPRESTTTSWRSWRREAVSGRPRKPLPPAMTTFMLSSTPTPRKKFRAAGWSG